MAEGCTQVLEYHSPQPKLSDFTHVIGIWILYTDF